MEVAVGSWRLAFGCLAAMLWLAGVYFFYHYRIWLRFYVVGAVGLAFLIIAVGRTVLPLEMLLEQFTAYHVHDVAGLFGLVSFADVR